MNRVHQPRPLVVLGLSVWMGTAAGAVSAKCRDRLKVIGCDRLRANACAPRRTTRRIIELRAILNWYSSQFKNNHFTEMCCGNEEGSHVRLRDSCITQPKAQGPARTCNESKEEEETSQPDGDASAQPESAL